VDAGRRAAIADIQHLADLLQGEPGSLGLPDEGKPVEDQASDLISRNVACPCSSCGPG
jgi:hypothetical protein